MQINEIKKITRIYALKNAIQFNGKANVNAVMGKVVSFLKKDDINIRIIDTYCIKPIDEETIRDASLNTKAIITVEDHFPEGGLGEAVSSIENIGCPVYILAVRNMPRSGKPEQLLDYESISKEAIIKKVSEIIK